jgi:hypothetical protein
MKLRDLAKVIRSKNAGPFWVTMDIMFENPRIYERVKATGALNRGIIADLYGIEEDKLQFFHYDPGFSYKVSIPRQLSSGSVGDSDVWGAQQHAPLLDIEIPLA